MSERKKWGDRKDGKLIRNVDSMHFIMPIIYPNRCDNEAFISEMIDLTALDELLESKNRDNPEYRYTMFHCIVTAVLKTITLRTKMNRFIANSNLYMRNEVSAAFTVKKEFSDDGDEVLAFVHSRPENNLDSIHDEILRQLKKLRKDNTTDASTDAMDFFNRLPRFLSKAIVKFVCILDRHGKVPASLIATDPYYSSVVLSNLGSLKMQAGYHHLTNWGTTSLFVTIGQAEWKEVTGEDGTKQKKHMVRLGLIVDERIADGYYYSGTVKLLKFLLENPQLLETPLNERVPDELWKKIR